MSFSAADFIPALVLAIVAGGYKVVTKFITPRATQGTRENSFMDQLQEQLSRAEASNLRASARELALINHILVLNAHIAEGKPPPPPPMPAELFVPLAPPQEK